jgi:xylulokinase
MALSVQTLDWDAELLDMAGIRRSQLPPVVASGTPQGNVPASVADRLGLPRGIVAVAGAHDQPAGALGAGIVHPGMAMYAVGTVECITPAFDRPVVAPSMLAANLCCEPHAVTGMWVTLAFNFSGGSLLRWYRDTLCATEQAAASANGRDVYDVITEGMSPQPPTVLILPHFAGSGTPALDPHALGAIVGLRLGTTKGELTRAVLEGPTFEMALNLESLANAGVEVRELRAIGGGARSDRWLQLKADVLGRPIHRLDLAEAGAFGAALLAGQGAGLWPSAAERAGEVVKTAETFEPHAATHRIYQERLAVYRDLYTHLQPVSHQLSNQSHELAR